MISIINSIITIKLVKNVKKKRSIHTVNFNANAEFIWRRVGKHLPRGWLSRFVSEALIKKFGRKELQKQFVKEMIRLLAVRKLELSAEQKAWVKQLAAEK